MSTSDLPVILIEVVLIFGGTLLFGWWQLRSVKRDRERSRAQADAALRLQAGHTSPAGHAGTRSGEPASDVDASPPSRG